MDNGQPPNLHEVAEQIAAIDRKVRALQAQRSRLERYGQALADVLCAGRQGIVIAESKTAVKQPVNPEVKRLPQFLRRHKTADMARLVLVENEMLNLDLLLKHMRERGWQGSGDDIKDKDTIRVALRRRPRQFERRFRGLWSIVRKTDSAEKSAELGPVAK